MAASLVPATLAFLEETPYSAGYDDVYHSVAGGPAETLTKDNPAADSGPVFSPDGGRLAYRAQKRAGFEADRWELMVIATADLDAEPKADPKSKDPKGKKARVPMPAFRFNADDARAIYLYLNSLKGAKGGGGKRPEKPAP